MDTRFDTFDEMIASIRSYTASTGHTVQIRCADNAKTRTFGFSNYEYQWTSAEERDTQEGQLRWHVTLTSMKVAAQTMDRALLRTGEGRDILADALTRGIEPVVPEHLRAGEQLMLPLPDPHALV